MNQYERVNVEKVTNEELFKKACEATIHSKSNVSLKRMYQAEHSPIRTQMFWIEFENIPDYVLVDFLRHKIGVEWFVRSLRSDRGGPKDPTEINRLTPRFAACLINAQALIAMARKRLCYKADIRTVAWMQRIKSAVQNVDSDLASVMVPDCIYKNGKCTELKPCGRLQAIIASYEKIRNN